jgi:hypothetical protein
MIESYWWSKYVQTQNNNKLQNLQNTTLEASKNSNYEDNGGPQNCQLTSPEYQIQSNGQSSLLQNSKIWYCDFFSYKI